VNLKFPFPLLLSLSIWLCLAPDRSIADEFTVEWKKVGDDLEIASVDVQTKNFLKAEAVMVRSALQRYRVGVVRAAEYGLLRGSVKTLCRAGRATVCINANFFDESGSPLGLVISRGIEHKRLHKGGDTLTGVFQVTRDGPQIISRADFEPAKVIEAVQAGPRLLLSGSKVQGLRDLASTRRSGVCLDAEHRLIMFAVSPGIVGISVEEMQNLLLDPGINCQNALNLDGGSSSQLYINSAVLGAVSGFQEVSVPGRDDVPVALGLFVDGD
jgi:exopolysaccharide biosynthesis protein